MKRLINFSIVVMILLGLIQGTVATASTAYSILWEQLRIGGGTDSNTAWSIMAEDFSLTEAATIAQVEFWNSWLTPPTIQIDFYDNADNLPGSLIISETLTNAVTVYDPNSSPQQYRTTLTLSTPLNLEASRYWVAIYASDENFNWAFGSPSSLPGSAYKIGAQSWERIDYNFAFRILGTTSADLTAPVVSVPEDMTVPATSSSGAEVTFEATATDDVDGLITPVCDPVSGSTFSIGTTTVDCTATDTAGNIGYASFTVTVSDLTSPVVTVPEDMTVPATSSSGAEVTFEATATDNVDGPITPVCVPESGSTFPIGATTVSCTATDAAGNIGSADFSVTVTRWPPEVWIDPAPSFPGEVVYGYIGFYSYGEGSFTCTIDWGDGTIEGPIDPFSGGNFCEATHSYASVGTYTVTASVIEAGGGTETASRQHHVVYYYTWGPDFWLTSNAVPTTIMLQAFTAAGHSPLTFTISSPPSEGTLGIPTLIDCYPLTMESLDSTVVSPAISAAGPAPQSVPEGKEPMTDLTALRDIDSSTEMLAAESPMICLANVVYTPTTPDPSYVGWDDFSFTVSDGVNAASAPGNVQLYLAPNTPPVAQDSSVKVAAASPTYVNLTATDSDVYNYNTDWLRFTIVDGPSNGTLGVPSWPDCENIYDEYWSPQGVTCTSMVLYTPDTGTSATTDSFTFKANDSHYDSNTATVSLTLHTPTTLTVNAPDDVDNGSCDTSHCSLREAVLYSGPGDTIDFALTPLPATITLVNGQLLVDKDLTIVGPGADLLAISGGAELEDPDPYAHDRVFSIGTWEGSPVSVSISGLTIRDGRAQDGGGVMVYRGNTLYMEDCVIGPNNIVTYAGGGIMNYEGDVTLNRCTVTENEGTGSLGGAGVTTAYGGTTTLINSTVSGNITNNFGGGLFVYDSVVRLIHTTVSGNISNANFDELYEERGGGAGIYFDPYGGGQVELHNSIVAGNTDMTDPDTAGHEKWPDVFGNITSLGGNLIGDPTGSTTTWDATDQVGTAESPLDPKLGALLKNDPGKTLTMALLTGSPAIDAVGCLPEVTIDQRGVARPQGDLCDIGAYELEQTAATGELKINKVFDPLTSGFTGTFAINYDCDDGETHDGTVNLAASGTTTITGIPTGTQCTITEPTLPTAPTGWTFGTATFSPESGVVTISEVSPAYAEVTVTNTISRDLGDLVISKDFDPLTSGFSGTFTIHYDCDNGETHDGTVNLSASGTTTIYDIPTGTICTVTEPTLPEAPVGWTFGEPSFDPENGRVEITGSGSTIVGISMVPLGAEVTVYNTISEDIPELGDLKISKVFDPLTSNFTDTFTIFYDCGGEYWAYISLGAGGQTTIFDIPLGSQCTISETTLPTPPTGWSFGTPTYSPADGKVTIGETVVEVTVTNTISRDLGELKISKTFDLLTSGFTGTFAINYDCDDGTTHDGTVNLTAGTSQTITGIPTGTQCTVTEPSLPTPPTGWSFGIPTYNPADGTVTISKTIAEVTVTNTISQDSEDNLSQLTSARTKCDVYAAGAADDLPRLFYTFTTNKKTLDDVLKSVTPSTFLYYVKATLPSGTSSLVIAQTNDSEFPAMAASVTLYDESCARLSPQLASVGILDGDITINFVASETERVVYVAVKYSAKPIIGQIVTGWPTIEYAFSAALNGSEPFTSADLEVIYLQ